MSEIKDTSSVTSDQQEEAFPIRYVTNNPSEAHSCEQAFNRLQQRMNQQNKIELAQRTLKLWRYGTIAASVALILTCCFVFLQPTPTENMKVLYTEAGNAQQFTLPDGTKVWMNADTRLLYPEKFTKGKREIYISGEAYFEVTKDKNRPFVVKTDKLSVTVLGTKFNVKSYPDEPTIETTLVEGSVSVDSEGIKRHETVLRPNQQLVLRKIDGKLALYDNINLKHYTGWVEGRLYFRQASIEEISKKLERSFNVKIHIESEKLRERKFTGRFDCQESIEDILNTIKLTTPYNYHRQGDVIVMKD